VEETSTQLGPLGRANLNNWISGFHGDTILMRIPFLRDATVSIQVSSSTDVLTVSSKNDISETSEIAHVFELVPS
jgi:hypothetical protein